MNKHLMFASVAVIAALASCSNNDTVEEPKGQAIGFKSMIDKNQSRAAEVLNNTTLDKFYVWGYADQGLNFNEQLVEKTGSVWTYSPEQYWEIGKAYAFVAVGSSEQQNCTAEFSVPSARPSDTSAGFGSFSFNNKDANGNEDVCYAVADVAAKSSLTSTEDKVDLAFKHALARVKFTFVNEMSSAYKLAVSDIKIINAAASGTFTIPTDSWEFDEETFELAFDDIAAMSYNNKVVAGEENTTRDNTGYQYILSGAQNLKITFTLTATTDAGYEMEYTHNTVAISLAEGEAYKNGNSYNFTAAINKDNIDPDHVLYPIEFAPSVEPWTTPDTENNVDVKPAGE